VREGSPPGSRGEKGNTPGMKKKKEIWAVAGAGKEKRGGKRGQCLIWQGKEGI